ncbi:MAG: HigA family addiction module antidote protein [Rhodospirillales bacterium]|nr:HigA family addiction module antidote protein [Rhodospirillales bacterium]
MPDLIPRTALARCDFASATEPGWLGDVTPGEVLAEEFMRPMRLSARALAAAIGVPANRITGILHGTRAITADTALRLARRFGTSAEFWMNLQTAHDLEVAARRIARAA